MVRSSILEHHQCIRDFSQTSRGHAWHATISLQRTMVYTVATYCTDTAIQTHLLLACSEGSTPPQGNCCRARGRERRGAGWANQRCAMCHLPRTRCNWMRRKSSYGMIFGASPTVLNSASDCSSGTRKIAWKWQVRPDNRQRDYKYSILICLATVAQVFFVRLYRVHKIGGNHGMRISF